MVLAKRKGSITCNDPFVPQSSFECRWVLVNPIGCESNPLRHQIRPCQLNSFDSSVESVLASDEILVPLMVGTSEHRFDEDRENMVSSDKRNSPLSASYDVHLFSKVFDPDLLRSCAKYPVGVDIQLESIPQGIGF